MAHVLPHALGGIVTRARTVGAASLAVVCLLLGGCGHLLFFPSPGLEITPREIGLLHDDVRFASADGTALHGWFLHARPEGTDPPPTVLFLHGNAGNIGTNLGGAYWLPSQGFNVFLFDYRGFGLSEGEVDLAGAHEDAAAALEYLAVRDDVDDDRIVVIGQSLGGAIALTTVARLRETVPVRAVVIDSAPSDFRGIAREKLGSFWLTWPVQWPLSLTIPGEPEPLTAAAALEDVPILYLHGEADEIVPVHHSRRLAAATENASFVSVPDVEHVQSMALPSVQRRVISFCRAALADGPSSVWREARKAEGTYPNGAPGS